MWCGRRVASDADWMSSTVTASSPLMMSHEGRRAAAAVVGLKMKYSTFYERYVNSTTSCRRTPSSDDNCNFTCRSPVSCASEMSRKFGAPGTSCTSTPYTHGRKLIDTGGVIRGGTFSPEKNRLFRLKWRVLVNCGRYF